MLYPLSVRLIQTLAALASSNAFAKHKKAALVQNQGRQVLYPLSVRLIQTLAALASSNAFAKHKKAALVQNQGRQVLCNGGTIKSMKLVSLLHHYAELFKKRLTVRYPASNVEKPDPATLISVRDIPFADQNTAIISNNGFRCRVIRRTAEQ